MVQYNETLGLNINFTKDGEQITGFLRPIKPIILINEETQKPELIFLNQTVKFYSPMRKSDDFLELQRAKEIGEMVSQILQRFGRLVAILFGFSILTGGGGGAALKMMRLFKLIYRYFNFFNFILGLD